MSTTRAVPQPEKRRNQAADRKTVGTLHDQCAAALASRSAKTKAAFFTEGAVRKPLDLSTIRDRQAVQTMFEGYFKQNTAKIKHTPLDRQVGGDGAHERGKIREAITPRPGQPLERPLKHLAILKRLADSALKIHVEIDNGNFKEPPIESC